jgi:excisionase family DNA binding protein
MVRAANIKEEPFEGMLTISQVASLLHAHPNTIRLWTNKGLLKSYRLGYRRDRRFRAKDIKAFLNENSDY